MWADADAKLLQDDELIRSLLKDAGEFGENLDSEAFKRGKDATAVLDLVVETLVSFGTAPLVKGAANAVFQALRSNKIVQGVAKLGVEVFETGSGAAKRLTIKIGKQLTDFTPEQVKVLAKRFREITGVDGVPDNIAARAIVEESLESTGDDVARELCQRADDLGGCFVTGTTVITAASLNLADPVASPQLPADDSAEPTPASSARLLAAGALLVAGAAGTVHQVLKNRNKQEAIDAVFSSFDS